MTATIEISAAERNEIWDLGEMELGGSLETIRRATERVDHDATVEARLLLDALDVLGLERVSEKGCSVPLTLRFIFVVDAAEKYALEVLEDRSKTLAKAIKGMSSEEFADRFLPPEEGDTEASFLIGLRHIKAVRERMERAEPGLRRGGRCP